MQTGPIEILDGIHETIRYDEFNRVKMYLNTNYEDFQPHWHSGIEIILPMKNGYTVRLQKNEVKLEEHDIIIINTGTIHSLHAPPTGERMIIQFDVSLLSILDEFESLMSMAQNTLIFRAKDNTRTYRAIYRNLLQIIKEYNDGREFREIFIYSKIIEIYGEIARQKIYGSEQSDSVEINKQSSVESMLKTCEFINRNYMENLTLERVAEVSGFSKYYFTRVFRQFTDKTFSEYLNQQRVNNAAVLLTNQEMSITEIALNSGFNSISSFNRAFRRVTGYSPSAYRKRTIQKKNSNSF